MAHPRILALGGTCRNGHKLTPENVYRRKDGYLECRACSHERVRKLRRLKT